MNLQDRLVSTLKQNGYSLTKPRQALFSALQAGKPRSMRELTLDLDSVMDRASIYRTIAIFEKLGIVVRVQQGWKYKIELSDKFSPHHHHITCLKCGKIISFDEPAGIEKILNDIAIQYDFVQKNHSLELEGYCSNCNN
jgi:Fur family ferric uptake transcriptional regulator